MAEHERKLLADIRTAAERILIRPRGKDLSQCRRDENLQLQGERLFTLLGEAAARLRRANSELAAKVPSITGPIAFRNFLIHVYDQIEHEKIWEIVQTDPQPPCVAIDQLLVDGVA